MATKVMKVVVFGSEFCPYCKRAVALLKKHNAAYTYIDTATEEGDRQRSILSKKYKHSTIPLILVNDQFVGGFDDLKRKVDANELLF